jgi:hypothetical protein
VNRLVSGVTAGVTLLAGAGVLAGPPPLAIAGGLLLGFVLPGLALTGAVFRGRRLTAVEHAMLAPALSLAVLVAAGLIIYVCGYALDRTAWTASTVLVTLVALAVPALPVRARPAAVDETVVLPYRNPGPPPPLTRLVRQLAPLALIIAMLGLAGYYSYQDSRRTYDVTVTALSMTPPGPPDATGRRTVDLTVTGLVAADGPYSLVVTAPGTPAVRRTVTVPADGIWSDRLTVGADRTTISLYRSRDTAAYRTLFVAAAE